MREILATGGVRGTQTTLSNAPLNVFKQPPIWKLMEYYNNFNYGSDEIDIVLSRMISEHSGGRCARQINVL